MPLAPGARLAYAILSPIGSGGMGEVYRARDTKLARDVAIKILPEALACDPDRIARFEREARTLAALNETHVARGRRQVTSYAPFRPREDMARGRTQGSAAVGVAEHGNSAVLVTVGPGGELLDRRRIDLTDRDLPTHPHHHEGSWAVGRYLSIPGARARSLAEAVALVERVHDAAARGACDSLEALAATVAVPIAGIALRVCPKLPPTIEERIADNRAANVADSVMYREALAVAAQARGWSVYWYERERVFGDAAMAIGGKDIDAFLRAMGRSIGPPWQVKHKLAAAAALAATARRAQ